MAAIVLIFCYFSEFSTRILPSIPRRKLCDRLHDSYGKVQSASLKGCNPSKSLDRQVPLTLLPFEVQIGGFKTCPTFTDIPVSLIDRPWDFAAVPGGRGEGQVSDGTAIRGAHQVNSGTS